MAEDRRQGDRRDVTDGCSSDPDRLLEVAVVARALDVCSETVRAWIRSGKLAAVRLPNGRYRIRAATFEALKTEQKFLPPDSQNSQTA